MTNSAIESQGLGKNFGAHWAVSGVDLSVAAGDIYGFLGRNGAGKTTTIRLMLGLMRPSAGTVRIFGHDVSQERMKAARLTGSLLEARATYDHLTGWENLDGTRLMLGLPKSEIGRVLEIVDMTGAQAQKVGHYSLGMRQRLGLARALLGSPRLLVLDEPMNGLDPDGIRDMRAIIRDLPARSGVTLFLSSHLLSEVQQTASHIGVMHDGQLVMQGPIHDLLKRVATGLYIRTDDVGETAQFLTGQGYRPIAEGTGLLIDITGDEDAARLNRALIDAGQNVIELSQRQPTLESLYMQAQHKKAA